MALSCRLALSVALTIRRKGCRWLELRVTDACEQTKNKIYLQNNQKEVKFDYHQNNFKFCRRPQDSNFFFEELFEVALNIFTEIQQNYLHQPSIHTNLVSLIYPIGIHNFIGFFFQTICIKIRQLFDLGKCRRKVNWF